MEYTKQYFKDGQVLTHEHLNHIEDGIEMATNRVMTGDFNIVPTIGNDGILYFNSDIIDENE